MRILIIGLNYDPEPIGIAVYTTGLAEGLATRGWEVEVISAKPYYPEWQLHPRFRGFGYRRSNEAGVRILRCPIYVPAKPTGTKRIVHYVSFALSALLPVVNASLRRRPDYVLVVAPSIIYGLVGLLGSKLSRAHSWLHVQDFEIGAAFATGLLDRKSLLAGVALRLERRLIGLFDQASSISSQMCKKLVELGGRASNRFELRNWADVDNIRPLERASHFRQQWKIQTEHVALYSGNIANKQGIDVIVSAARALAHRKDLTFVICGDGPYKHALMAMASDLPNIQFQSLQPKQQLNELLGLATIHLLPQKENAADLVLPSKLTNMLASGRPVVATASVQTDLWREVEHCGVNCTPESPSAMAAAIELLIDSPALYRDCARNARQRALERWDRDAIIDALVLRLEQPRAILAAD